MRLGPMETAGRTRAWCRVAGATVMAVSACAAAVLAVACGREPAATPAASSPARASARPVAPSPAAPSNPTSAPAAPRPRIVFLGDSLTAGYGLEKPQSIPSLIQARLEREGYRFEVVNAGVSGDTSAG